MAAAGLIWENHSRFARPYLTRRRGIPRSGAPHPEAFRMSSLSPAEQALHYPFEALPQPGETLPVAPGIHWVRMALPYALDHINLWLLEDGEDWEIGRAHV